MEIALHKIEHFDDEGVADGIKNLVAGFPAKDNVLRTKHSEVLRSIGLFNPEMLYQAARGQLAFTKLFYDGDPRGMSERLKEIGFKAAERVLHVLYYIR